MAASNSWADPNRCPFCGDSIPSPGKGFMLHIGDNPDCDAEFDTWRDRISDDIHAGWSG